MGKYLELEGFDLVLSDIRMPRMNGLELAREVRVNFAATPIDLMTGDLPDNPAELAAQVGAAHIMSKIPLDNLLEKSGRRVKGLIDQAAFPITSCDCAISMVFCCRELRPAGELRVRDKLPATSLSSFVLA